MAETSVSNLKPTEFYKFSDSVTEWRFTDSYQIETYDGQTYLPKTIARSKLQQSGADEKQNIKVRMPLSEQFVLDYIARSNSDTISCTVFRRAGGLDLAIYLGRISGIEVNDEEAEFAIANLASDVLRPSGGYPIQLTCPHYLYGAKCKVDRTDFKLSGTVTSATSTTMTSATFGTKPDDWLTGGFIEINSQKITISGHTGNTINLFTPVNFDATNKTFNAFAGCDRLLATCNTKFSNLPNYGGFSDIPNTSPYTGDAITT